jgi:hypothetical protein
VLGAIKSFHPSNLSDGRMASACRVDVDPVEVHFRATSGDALGHFGASHSLSANDSSATLPTPPSHSVANQTRRCDNGRCLD